MSVSGFTTVPISPEPLLPMDQPGGTALGGSGDPLSTDFVEPHDFQPPDFKDPDDLAAPPDSTREGLGLPHTNLEEPSTGDHPPEEPLTRDHNPDLEAPQDSTWSEPHHEPYHEPHHDDEPLLHGPLLHEPLLHEPLLHEPLLHEPHHDQPEGPHHPDDDYYHNDYYHDGTPRPLAQCTIQDNNCLFGAHKGGCEGQAPGLPRVGLPNPFCMMTNGARVIVDETSSTPAELENDLLNAWLVAREASSGLDGGLRDLYGAAVRLAFHDALELDRHAHDTFGSDGCLSARSADHDGLWEQTEEVASIFEPLWQAKCDRVSRADFWAAMGTFALRDADTSGFYHLSGKLPITFGRTDNCNCDAVPEERFPANQGVEVLERVFVEQMGLAFGDATLLLGAHTLGSMSTEHSGMGFSANGTTWVDNPMVFDNTYYKDIVDLSWVPHGPVGTWADFEPATPERHNIAMLNIDMVVGFQLDINDALQVNPASLVPRGWCGKAGPDDCGHAYPEFGCCVPTAQAGQEALVRDLSDDNDLFLRRFANSWRRMNDATRKANDRGHRR